MAKYGLYSKNNLNECITVLKRNYLHSAILDFKILKNLSIEEFNKLFEVKEIR